MQMKRIAAIAFSCAALIMSAQASAWCVKVHEANLREGPGTQFEKSWLVYKFMPFKKIGQQGSWLKVADVDGDEHWIYSKLLTNSIRCAVVNADDVTVRTGPGTNYAKSSISPLDRYYSLKVLNVKGEWVKFEDEVGNKGWVYKPLVWVP